jgi:hypothetical protein
MARQSVRGDLMRRALAQEAARIMVDHGVEDFLFAKRKAAERMGVTDHAVLPRNTEIEQAIAEHHRLFGSASHAGELAELRRHAVAAMKLLEEFEPRLVGPVLAGTAAPHADILLHIFADTPETVAIGLMDRHVRHRVGERRVKVHRGEAQAFPSIQFASGNYDVDAVIFPRDGIRQAPLSPVDGRPMRRATREEVEALLDTGLAASGEPLE